jgi:hypothetical protein
MRTLQDALNKREKLLELVDSKKLFTRDEIETIIKELKATEQIIKENN